MTRTSGILAAAGLLVALLAAPVGARADFFAVTEVQTRSGDLDLTRIDLSTRERVALPSGVNTAADELHPSLSPDGKRLTFERVDASAGTRRILVTDLANGTSADLFSSFEAGSLAPTDPAWFAGASLIGVGRALDAVDATHRRPTITAVDVSGFPGGPFPKAAFPTWSNYSSPSSEQGRTLQFEERGGTLAGDRRTVDVVGISSTRPANERVAVFGGEDPGFLINAAKFRADPTSRGGVRDLGRPVEIQVR